MRVARPFRYASAHHCHDAILFSLLLLAIPGFGQDEEEDPFRPGLIGRYENRDGSSFERVDRAISFTWRAASPDRRMATGAFRVQWRGQLQSQANGSYQLHAHFAGRLKIVFRDETILDAVSDEATWRSSPRLDLAFDAHPIQILFEKTSDQARVALFWSGPQFSLEPISGQQLFHDRQSTPGDAFDRGEQLVRALRCAACHEVAGEPPIIPAPSLEHVAGTMHREWLVRWLQTSPATAGAAEAASDRSEAASARLARIDRRMPHLGIPEEEAVAITTWLFDNSLPITHISRPAVSAADSTAKPSSKNEKGDPEPPPNSPVEAGREWFFTVGCLACHSLGQIGRDGFQDSLFDGGDLSRIAAKRPAGFFRDWLDSPESLNANHRMPVFEATPEEKTQLAAFLATLGAPAESARPVNTPGHQPSGLEAIATYRCAACHVIPDPGKRLPAPGDFPRTKLTAGSNWTIGCTGDLPRAEQPRYTVDRRDRMAIQAFISQAVNRAESNFAFGRRLLLEKNCLACHQREHEPGLAERLLAVGTQHAEFAPRIPAMTPPPLNSVGDKLNDAALRAAITRQGAPHRPYLLVRMPRFQLADAELQALEEHFISADRIPASRPAEPPAGPALVEPALLEAAGSRLVTPDGFGCTSCHQVGKVLPVKTPLNARGPDLSRLGSRVRREWYDRWVRNPSRIVPRMEMPSVQVAVRGLLQDNLDQQLAAVWDVLNKPDFQPPLPNPVRVVRHTGTRPEQPAIVITDVLKISDATYIKPLLLGLSNRHNVLFDLETARLTSWSIGDTARQRTEGKTWYWEAGGKEIVRVDLKEPEISALRTNELDLPQTTGQFVTEFDALEHIRNQLRVCYRLHVGSSARPLLVTQTFAPLIDGPRSGFQRTVEVAVVAPGEQIRFAVFNPASLAHGSLSDDHRVLTLREPSPVRVALQQPASARFTSDGVVVTGGTGGKVQFELEYSTSLLVDQFVVEPPLPAPLKAETLHVVPGFSAVRLPLTEEVMPTAIGWRPNGSLLIASLKGQVWQASDTDRDGLADQLRPVSDELAAPYGLFATDEYVDVVNKYGVLRLWDDDGDGQVDRTVTLASGWGHTADYHDWAVGLPRDGAGNYYVALPCQQDRRLPAAAKFRGEFLKLVPREPTADDPHAFALETISRGHRFPMGIARRRDGELFLSDNQGHYNPFNELNHVQPGRHFGFINALESGIKQRPPLTPPAINLPHPWVRSVNGICFLETPAKLLQETGRQLFGPFEGDLIGCEYDTRRLIRVSLQKVGETFQGAAYPFSLDQPAAGPPLLGPLACEVAPDGSLYVGGIRDSGWGGANNIGEVVRLQLQPEQLPCGIAEMRVVPDGFEIDFTAAVDRQRAGKRENYSLHSYTRESTPAYGGPDLFRRTEQVQEIQVSSDGRRATLRLAELRPGYVYELHVKQLVPDTLAFFPAEAHYTLWKVLDDSVP